MRVVVAVTGVVLGAVGFALAAFTHDLKTGVEFASVGVIAASAAHLL